MSSSATKGGRHQSGPLCPEHVAVRVLKGTETDITQPSPFTMLRPCAFLRQKRPKES
jgi:hypothetical protein